MPWNLFTLMNYKKYQNGQELQANILELVLIALDRL